MKKRYIIYSENLESGNRTIMVGEDRINIDNGFYAQERCDILSLDVGQSILLNDDTIITRVFDSCGSKSA